MRKLLGALLLASLPAFAQFGHQYLLTYDHTKVGGGSEDEANFPALVSASNALLRSAAHSGGVNSSTGADLLAFSDSGCTAQLPSELESYDPVNGVAVLFVNAGTLSHTSNGSIYLCFGNASPPARTTAGVWDSHFVGVWHFANGSTLSVADSTGTNTSTNHGATAGTGTIDGAAMFGSGTPYIAAGSGLTSTGPMTISMWQQTTNCGSVATLAYISGSSISDFLVMGCTGSLYIASAASDIAHSVQSTIAPTGTPTHLAATKTGGVATHVYVNGVDKTTAATGYNYFGNGSGTGLTNVLGTDFYTGSSSLSLSGYLDEVRISNIVRSSGWIATEYANTSNPGNIGSPGFWTYGVSVSGPYLSWSSCPSSGNVAVASSTCTVTLTNAAFDGTTSVTLSDVGNNGTFTSSLGGGTGSVTLTPTASSSSFTFTYTAAVVGSRSWTMTASNSAWTTPAANAYAVTSSEADTFTAKANGNWTAAGTWNCSGTCSSHSYPRSGDSVAITGYTVTCPTAAGTCYAGTAPANNTIYDLTIANSGATDGILELQSGATLWLTGNYKLNGSNGNTSGGVLKLDTGATFIHDQNNNASVVYRGVGGTAFNWNNIYMGTAGDSCGSFTASRSYSCPTVYKGVNISGTVYPQLYSMNGMYSTIHYHVYGTGFKYCGSASLPCLDVDNASTATSAVIVDIENSVFDTTTPLGNTVNATNTRDSMTWVNNREVNDIVGFLTYGVSNNYLYDGASCTITGNYFDGTVGVADDRFYGCNIWGNVFSVGYWGSIGTTVSFHDNLHILRGLPSGSANVAAYTPFFRNIFYQDGYAGSAHMGLAAIGSNETAVGNLADRGGVSSEALCSGQENVSTTIVLLDNLSVMTANGDPACIWSVVENNLASQAGPTLYADHNGMNGMPLSVQFGWFGVTAGPGYNYPTNAVLRAVRANLNYSPTAGSYNLWWADLQGEGATPTTLVDANTVVDWNNSYNGTSSSLFSGTPFYHTIYQINSNTAAPGSHETTVNPKYIDTTRRVDTWASRVMGQAQSIDGARAALWACPNIPACIGNLYNWVRQGWQPTNIALKGSAHDGKIIGFSGAYGSGYSGTCGVT